MEFLARLLKVEPMGKPLDIHTGENDNEKAKMMESSPR